MTKTNAAIAGDGKAIAAHMRNQTKPEGADHLELKNQPGEDGTAPDQGEIEAMDEIKDS